VLAKGFPSLSVSQRVAQGLLRDVKKMGSGGIVLDHDRKRTVKRATHSRLQAHPLDQIGQCHHESL
jgi:hypothetical protein